MASPPGTSPLQVGDGGGFLPAIGLYESAGFERCGPFAGYREDPHSLFMTRRL